MKAEWKVTHLAFAVTITEKAGLHGRLRSEVCNAAMEGQACVGPGDVCSPQTSTTCNFIVSRNNLWPWLQWMVTSNYTRDDE